jgi:HAD superfamily hydrolase (TIGR01549 family)
LPKKSLVALSGRSIRCILFDLGDTLWTRQDMAVWQRLEKDAHLRAAMHLRRDIASALLPGRTEEELGKRLHRSVEENLQRKLRQDPYLEPDGSLAVVQSLANWGIPSVQRSTGAAIFEDLRVRIAESRQLFADVHPTLKILRQRGFQLGIVTNRHWGGELFQQDLQTLGLLDHFEPRHMAISVDLGVSKPNPAIFLHALNALNVPPEEAAMVGDALLADITGSKMLGIFGIWKPTAGVLAQAQLIASSSGAVSARHPGDVPAGIHITADDYVLGYAHNRAGKWDEHLHSEVKPDLIIQTLGDLLDIFHEVGEQ